MIAGDKMDLSLKILLIDGYIDEPGCLGVPPFLAPLPRYIAGAIREATSQQSTHMELIYCTIDQFRHNRNNYQQNAVDLMIVISGVTVPGKYLGARPISYREIRELVTLFSKTVSILCGPATKYGIGEEGGRTSRGIKLLEGIYDLILEEDADWAIFLLFTQYRSFLKSLRRKKHSYSSISQFNSQLESLDRPNVSSQIIKNLREAKRPNIHSLQPFAIAGPSWIIPQHPNFNRKPFGNLICEIETFQGCPRYRTGGCRFCIEPLKGPTQHRKIEDIVEEVVSLYEIGVRHFRLGSQTDFYAFQHREFIHPKYPQPNVKAIYTLLSEIRKKCPNLETLHIDNVNALNFSLYPEEAEEITNIITEYCTSGNIAAIGVESIVPEVIRANNLKAKAEEIEQAIKIINLHGSRLGVNGTPLFLPGLNFIMGLPGETAKSLQQNYDFLLNLLKKGYLIRRINLRKFLVSNTINKTTQRWVRKHLNKYQSKYFHWKAKIRDEIDYPMLQRLFPFGSKLFRVYAEKHDGKGTLARQIGTYPIRCFIPKKIPLHQFYDLKVVNHGARSLVCLVTPVKLISLTQKELEAIDGIGKSRAQTIQHQKPESEGDWNRMEKKIQDIRRILED